MGNPPVTAIGAATANREDRLRRRASGYERDGLASVLLSVQQRTLEELHLTPADRLLDVGCATGAAVRIASQRVRTAIGVDRSRAMIGYARSRSASHPGARFVHADAQALPFRSNSFTAVLCTSVLAYLDHPDIALAEMARVLSPGGRLAFGYFEWNAQPHRIAWPPGLTRVARPRLPTPIGHYQLVLATRSG